MFYHNIINNVSADLEYQKALAAKYNNEFAVLPEGQLYKKHQPKRYDYYHILKPNDALDVVRKKYITKQDQKLMIKLKRKRLLEVALKRLNENIKLEEKFLSKYREINLYDLEKSLPFIYTDIPSVLDEKSPSEIDKFIWKDPDYIKNSYNTESLKHSTLSGLMVRSKSEAIIADLLEANNIIFRYEAMLKLGSRTIFPDFTIMSPVNGELLYWEHFGMADDQKYSTDMYRKIELYIQHGIIPGNQLIMSFETKDVPTNPVKILALIEAYILK